MCHSTPDTESVSYYIPVLKWHAGKKSCKETIHTMRTSAQAIQINFHFFKSLNPLPVEWTFIVYFSWFTIFLFLDQWSITPTGSHSNHMDIVPFVVNMKTRLIYRNRSRPSVLMWAFKCHYGNIHSYNGQGKKVCSDLHVFLFDALLRCQSHHYHRSHYSHLINSVVTIPTFWLWCDTYIM